MQGDDPPFLPVGTDVSAKYKGAFCEAKIKKVVRNIKCRVNLKAGGIITVNDDAIKGILRVGTTVEVKQDPKKDAMEAVISKIQDCSQYTVVFDDGDITTLRRSALCLKSGRHFNESETLDQLPLTHPEHFSTPVIAGRRGRRGRAQSDESEGEGSVRPAPSSGEREPHAGRVVLVEAAGGAERRRPHQPAFPALVVAPTAQINVKEDYLVRSFKDGRYYTVPKKEAREFRKGSAPLEWAGVEAALQYLNNGVLPPHWDRDALFNEPKNTSDDSSDDEPREEKDHFVAQLYKFMDDRGTPLDRNPTIANRDVDLYKLFRAVYKLGGYNRVTNQNQWKTIADKMGFNPLTTNISNLCNKAYKKYLHSFEDFYRKLGVTLVAHPRGARTPPAGRSLIRDRDKQLPTSSSASSTPTNTPAQRGKESSDKSETDKSEKSEKEDKIEKLEKEKPKEKVRASDEEDSADNQPLAVVTPKIEKDKEKATTSVTAVEEKSAVTSRSQSKNRSTPPAKTDLHEKRLLKRRPTSSKNESSNVNTPRASRRPHVSTDSDSSGRASRCSAPKKPPSRRSQSANSASSGNTIASNSSKRTRKRKTTEPSTSNDPVRTTTDVKAQVGDKLKVYYGPTQSESKVTYEAKVIEISSEGMLRVHYTGWNTRYDEWIKPQRIAINVTQHETKNKKNNNINRRVRPQRAEASSTRSDSDSDSDSDGNNKRPPKKPTDKLMTKTLRTKEVNPGNSNNSNKPRKRPSRTGSTPTSTSPTKKPRINLTGHQGRDYDLNEIRSELKGLHSVKQEPEECKQDIEQKISKIIPIQISAPEPIKPEPEKELEDVYEFKEPEPFEIELHDEKKKRTHRIFDDISPSKYVSTLSKSLSEEISEDTLRPRTSSLRSPNLSPFRDLGLTRDVPGRQSPEDDSKDGLFSLDDDSFPGDGSSGPIFEGFTPAKNQETYSKKSKVSKLRELIDDSPESPADDEQSSEDDSDDILMKEDDRELSPEVTINDKSKYPEFTSQSSAIKEVENTKELSLLKENNLSINPTQEELLMEIPDLPKTPPLQINLQVVNISPTNADNNTVNKPTVTIPTDKKEDLANAENDLKERIGLQKINVINYQEKLNKIEEKKPEEIKTQDLTKQEAGEKIINEAEKPLVIKDETTKIMETKKDIDKQKEDELKKQNDKDSSKHNEVIEDEELKKQNESNKKVEIKTQLDTSKLDEIKEQIPIKNTGQVKEGINKLLFPNISKVCTENIFKINTEKKNVSDNIPLKLELPSSPLIDTEEDKSEPDSPARIDVLPEPPPGFLLQSEGPKIAEKLLQAINSAKRLSITPPPPEEEPVKDYLNVSNLEEKLSPVSSDTKPAIKLEPFKQSTLKIEPFKSLTINKTEFKPLSRPDPNKKFGGLETFDSIFGEPSSPADPKREFTEVKKNKPKEPTPPRLQSPLNILERRKSIADLPLTTPGKNNKVLSDTIQKLSSQINQSAVNITLPPFPPADRSESSDSDDSDRRLIMSVDEWGSGGSSEASRGLCGAGPPVTISGAVRSGVHAGKSPGEWSAGESLLMLEDACKNERKHSASVVVAGSGRTVIGVGSSTSMIGINSAVVAAEEDSNISLLLCEETIPGSPAPDADPAPTRHRLHMPFASAPQHHSHTKDDPRGDSELRVGGGEHAVLEGERAESSGTCGAEERGSVRGWGRRHALLDNTPPTTPDSSLDMSPHRERDSPTERKEDDGRPLDSDAVPLDSDKGHGLRSRKASESSAGGAGAGRGRRRRRDTDEHAHAHMPPSAISTPPAHSLKYNFYIDLDPSWDSVTRINVLTSRLTELRKAYHAVKAELAAIDRRRKKLRRKEREAVKAAKAACS